MVCRLTQAFLDVSESSTSLTKLTKLVLKVRFLMIVGMAISCSLIPDFVGDDESLVTFDLRLKLHGGEHSLVPFNIDGSVCESNLFSTRVRTVTREPPKWVFSMWSFVLTPHTRWDSARFLRIAHRPSSRYPKMRFYKEESATTEDHRRSAILNEESEEAHAFLPLFPFMVQLVASLLSYILPPYCLPPSCEGLLTLSALVWNTICTVIATLALYQTTSIYLVGYSNRGQLSSRTALLFITSPASVFFVTSYSEATVAALVFSASLLWSLCKSPAIPATWYGAWGLLYLACWVRSNGSIYAGYILLYGMGLALSSNLQTFQRILAIAGSFCVAISLVLGGLVLHNYLAVMRHCSEAIDSEMNQMCHCDEYRPPEWCSKAPWFNLYSYVQKQHWDVGLFNYYELKQIPNFLLASPVILLSVAAVSLWIYNSWDEWKQFVDRPSSSKQNNRLSFFVGVVRWSIYSLRLFTGETSAHKLKSKSPFLTSSPLLLGHYAVLCATTMLLLVVAHIQISTRLIFSSCPAIYWYLVTVISQKGLLGELVLVWCLLYHILGVVMHPNWLPWT